MGISEAIKTCFSKYFIFSGRAPRPEYWWFVLFVFLGALVLSIIDAALFGGGASSPLASVFQLATFIPLLAAGWRRMHDSGRPGWYLLLPMLLGLFYLLFMMGGAMTFGAIEQSGQVDPEALRGPAAFLGGAGMLLVSLTNLVLLVLMIWWLTRPSDPEPNAYGPPPRLTAA